MTHITANPADMADKFPDYRRNRHFEQRCIERGIVETDGHQLWRGLCWAIRRRREDLVEFCKATGDAKFFRFRCADGIFYAVVPRGLKEPATVFDQSMYRETMAVHKKRKGGYLRKKHKPLRMGRTK